MRNHIKQQVLELLETMFQMHSVLDDNPEYIELCNQASKSIIATLNGDYISIMKLLEDYQLQLKEIKSNDDSSLQQIEELNERVAMCYGEIEGIENTYHIVFFPYSAAMWDCLESIYFESIKDSRCICSVVPIPYYTYDCISRSWIYVYEGDKFPHNVPIIHYKDYDLEKNKPDVGYIHNPYDDDNLVTRVEETYFSFNLKKYVNTLVYVPYYLRANNAVLPYHRFWESAYPHVDYIIKRNEWLKEMLRETPFYEKVLALGSPKVDRILQLQKQGVEIPQEWAEVVSDRPVLMVNLTIGSLLNYGEIVFEKLIKVFEKAKKQNIAVVFRPHPLLSSTIDAMRPNVKSLYQEFLDTFLNSEIGILDKTADVTKTVVLCDGYIGCPASSMVHLFDVAKKPIYNIDYALADEGIQKSYMPRLSKIQLVDEYYLGISDFLDVVFKFDLEFEKIQYFRVRKADIHAISMYNNIVCYEKEVLFLQKRAEQSISYDIEEGTDQSFLEADERLLRGSNQVLVESSILYFIPSVSQSKISVYDLKEKTLRKHEQCVREFRESGSYTALSGCVNRGVIYVCAADSNDIMQLFTKTGKYKISTLDYAGGLADICIDNDILWITGADEATLIRYSISKQKTQIYQMPLNFKISNHVRKNDIPVFSGIHKIGTMLVLIPENASAVCVFDTKTRQSFLLFEDIFRDVFDVNTNLPVCKFSQVLPNGEILLQRYADNQLFILNVKDRVYRTVEPKMEEALLMKLKEEGLTPTDFGISIKDNSLIEIEEFLAKVKHGKTDLRERMSSADDLELSGKRIHQCIMEKVVRKVDSN